MRFLLVLAFATVALAGTVRMSDRIDSYVLDLLENNGEIEMAVDHEQGTVESKLRRQWQWIFKLRFSKYF